VIQKTIFGKFSDGREVSLYTLTIRTGASVKITNFGATVTSLSVPDRNGKQEDVVLGYDSFKDYADGISYFGATVGRYANRIAKGKFTLEGKEYRLAINSGKNNLHGGNIGFDKALWDANIIQETANPAIEMSYRSADGEEGFPGNVTLTVRYTLTEINELRIEYTGTSDNITVLNPTHHSYFNLSGSFTNSILNHELSIYADSITPVDDSLIPTGQLMDVTNTPMDFRSPLTIGTRINDRFEQLIFGGGYDHNWVLNNYDRKVHKAAELYENISGRLMTVYTDQPGLQFYSGNFINGKGKGVIYKPRTGLCLEAQCFPDSPNKPQFPSVILKPGDVYRQTTIYQFLVK
jgi:aldose 1-epimerase